MSAQVVDYFDNWFFTTDKSSNTCPGITFKCEGPGACARDPNTGTQYCCDSGSKSVCWRGSTKCASDGSTMTCGSGTTSWCCLANREKCTETNAQINICWSTANDTLRQIDVASLRAASSSLASARPSATSLIFTPADLIAATRTESSSSSSSSSSQSTAATTTTNTGSNSAGTATPTSTGSAGAATTGTGSSDSGAASSSSSDGLSAGAIAGVVVGLVVALAGIGLVGFFLWRRSRRQGGSVASEKGAHDHHPHGAAQSELDSNNASPRSQALHPAGYQQVPAGYRQVGGGAEADSTPLEYYGAAAKTSPHPAPSELDTPLAAANAVEMPTTYGTAVELPAHQYNRDSRN